MTSCSSSASASPRIMLKEAAERRADLIRERDDILDRNKRKRQHKIHVFAEARGYLPEPLRDYLLPVGADGFPSDDCLFRRDEMNQASDAEREARFRYHLAHEALEWQRGLAEAVRLLPPDRDERNAHQNQIELEVWLSLTGKLEEIERLCVSEPLSPKRDSWEAKEVRDFAAELCERPN